MKRILAVPAVVTAIRQANGVSPYNFDLSPAHVTNSTMDTIEARLRMATRYSVRVWDGAQVNNLREATSRREQSQLEVVAGLLIKDLTADTLFEQMNKLLLDVTRALGEDQYLSGNADLARIGTVDAPSYDPEGLFAYCTVHIGVQYDFDALTEI